MEELESLVRALQYEHVDNMCGDVTKFLAKPLDKWRTWRIKVEEYQSISVVSLHGGLTVERGSDKMVLPVRILLPRSYPNQCYMLRLRSPSVLIDDGMPIIYVSETLSNRDMTPKMKWLTRFSTISPHTLYDYLMNYDDFFFSNLSEWIETQLHSAVMDGKLDIVKLLIKRDDQQHDVTQRDDANMFSNGTEREKVINFMDKNDKTPLHIAVEHGHLHIVRYLLDQGAHLNFDSSSPSTIESVVIAFSHLVWQDQVNLMKEVIVAGAEDGDDVMYHFFCVMKAAIQVSNQVVLLNLVEMGACMGTTMVSALRLAAEKGQDIATQQIILALLDSGVDINESRNYVKPSPLQLAITTNHLSLMHLLINNGVDLYCVDKYKRTALNFANSTETALALLARGMDVNVKGREEGVTPLFCVKDVETMALLINHGALVNARERSGLTPLHKHAIYMDEFAFDRLCLLLASGAQVTATDTHNNTPLHNALRGSVTSANFIRALQAHMSIVPVDNVLTITNYLGETVLHVAATTFFCGADCLSFLVDCAVQSCPHVVNLADNAGRTALHHAASYAVVKKVQKLITAGAQINLRDGQGRTALHTAASFIGYFAVPENVKALLEAGADVNARDHSGRSALHLACGNWSVEAVVTLLLSATGTQVNTQDNAGQTALHYAATNTSDNTINTVRLLLDHGADKDILDNEGHDAAHCATIQSVKALLNTRKRKAEDEPVGK